MFNFEFRCAVWLVIVLSRILSLSHDSPTFVKIIRNFRDILDNYSKNIDCSFASSLTSMSESELNETWYVNKDQMLKDIRDVSGSSPYQKTKERK